MAVINSIAVSALLVRSVDVGTFAITGKPLLPSVAQGDQITLFTAPHAMRVHYSTVRVPATLGAAATVSVRINKGGGAVADRTNTSTAGTAGVISSNTFGAFDMAPGDTLELFVRGGALTGDVIEYDFLCSRA